MPDGWPLPLDGKQHRRALHTLSRVHTLFLPANSQPRLSAQLFLRPAWRSRSQRHHSRCSRHPPCQWPTSWAVQTPALVLTFVARISSRRRRCWTWTVLALPSQRPSRSVWTLAATQLPRPCGARPRQRRRAQCPQSPRGCARPRSRWARQLRRRGGSAAMRAASHTLCTRSSTRLGCSGATTARWRERRSSMPRRSTRRAPSPPRPMAAPPGSCSRTRA